MKKFQSGRLNNERTTKEFNFNYFLQSILIINLNKLKHPKYKNIIRQLQHLTWFTYMWRKSSYKNIVVYLFIKIIDGIFSFKIKRSLLSYVRIIWQTKEWFSWGLVRCKVFASRFCNQVGLARSYKKGGLAGEVLQRRRSCRVGPATEEVLQSRSCNGGGPAEEVLQSRSCNRGPTKKK